MTEHFGGGPTLDRNLDFEIDEKGDITTEVGVEELQKDVAFRSANELEDIIGEVIDPTTMNRIRSKVRTAIDNEPRITGIISIQVSRISANHNAVEVSAQVVAFGDRVSLVFVVEDN